METLYIWLAVGIAGLLSLGFLIVVCAEVHEELEKRDKFR